MKVGTRLTFLCHCSLCSTKRSARKSMRNLMPPSCRARLESIQDWSTAKALRRLSSALISKAASPLSYEPKVEAGKNSTICVLHPTGERGSPSALALFAVLKIKSAHEHNIFRDKRTMRSFAMTSDMKIFRIYICYL